ncbi:MAG: tyrosine-type recombinase/integrase [Verrucomicrobiaceae bacterium]|nr:tyrosine-type recombinase/integrase [Verrucomicrobiaceae bacterium]
MQGLYLRGNIYWVRFTPAPNLPEERFSTGERDEAKAIARAREIKEKVSKVRLDKSTSSQIEIDAFLAACRNKSLAPSTIETRKYVLESFVDDLRLANPRLATPLQIERWYVERKERNAYTARDYLATVRLWFKWLYERGKIASNPAAAVVMPKKLLRKRRSFLMPKDARRLITDCEDLHLKFACYCALHAGLRKLEVIEARVNWFDLDAGLLHIQKTPTFEPKDRDNRTIPLTNEFRQWLKEVFWQAGIPEPQCFAFRPEVQKGKARYRADFKVMYNNLIKQLGLAVTFHDLRRTFASLLVSKGVSLFKVAQWLGDTIEVVEDTYAHLIQQDDEINRAWEEDVPPKSKKARKKK